MPPSYRRPPQVWVVDQAEEVGKGTIVTQGKGSGTPLYFICYSHADARLAEQIEAKLAGRRRRGTLELWRDRRQLSGGDRFTAKIRDAIETAAGAIVLVGDEFYASDYIFEHELPAIERRLAEDENFCIFPISTTQLDSDDELRDTYSFVNDPSEPLRYVDDAARDTVLTKLSEEVASHASSVSGESTFGIDFSPQTAVQTPATHNEVDEPIATDLHPGLHSVPTLPQRFVEPPEVAMVASQLTEQSVTGITGVRGEGGTGKSVLAAAVARRSVDQFPGGIHWITVGEDATSEDVRQLQQDLLRSLGEPVASQLADVDEGKDYLKEALARRPALLVIDDVWHGWQTRAFAVGFGATSRVLFTTRFPEVLPHNAAEVDLGRLSPSEALAFVRHSTNGLEMHDQDLALVLELAGGLRLALAVISASAVAAGGWAPIIEQSNGLRSRFGTDDDASSAHKAIHIAIEGLADSDRRLLWRLAALPPDTRVPLSILQLVWGGDRAKALELANTLVERRLAVGFGSDKPSNAEISALEFHDHVVDFLVLESPTSPDQTHLRLWEAGTASTARDWDRLADAEPYLWDRLVWHGCRGGLNQRALTDFASNFDWLTTRIARSGAAAAGQDIEQVATFVDISPESHLGQLRRVLRHDALFDNLANIQDLRDSLGCWIEAGGSSLASDDQNVRFVAGVLPAPSPALQLTLQRHTGVVWAATLFGEGRRVATAGTDGMVRVWDTTTGDVITEFSPGDGTVWSVIAEPGGARLATAGADGAARVFTGASGDLVSEFVGHTDQVLSVAFHPNATRLASGGADGRAFVWGAVTGQQIHELEGHTDAVFKIVFNNTGTRIATACMDGFARVWDAETGTLEAEFAHQGFQMLAVSFHPDGQLLATGCSDGVARVYDIERASLFASLAPDDLVDLKSEGLTTTAPRSWDAIDGHTTSNITSGTQSIFDVAFSSVGAQLVTGGYDATARLWNLSTGEISTELIGHSGVVTAVEYDSVRNVVATTSVDGSARIWDPHLVEEPDVTGRASRVGAVAFDPTGARLLTGSSDETASIWDVATGNRTSELVGHTNQVWLAAFDQSGHRVVTGSADRTARVWDSATGQSQMELIGHSGAVWGVSFSPDGSSIATASSDHTARIWDSTTAETLLELVGHGDRLEGLDYSPDGELLVTASFDKTARVWATSSGDTEAVLEGHEGAVCSASFDPSGRLVATTSYDGTARIWDATSGRTLLELSGHSNQVWRAAFSADGNKLATGSLDGTIRIWDTASGACLHTLGVGTSGMIDWKGDLLALSTTRHWALLEVSGGDPSAWTSSES